MKSNRALLFLLSAVFAALVSLLYQFRVFDTRIVFILDSAHYLLTSTELFAVLKAALLGQFHAAHALMQNPEFVANVMIDGPVLPVLGALTFLLSGQPPAATSWSAIVTMLSLLAAISAGTLSLLCLRLTKSPAISLSIAFLFACYPTTVCSSGRFLTEPVAICILVVLAWFCSNMCQSEKEDTVQSFSSGLLVAIGFLLKPALLPAWAFCVGVSFILRLQLGRKVFRTALAIVLGFFCVIGLWLGFTKVTTDQLHAMPQRQLASNVAQGHDFETDGRGSMGPLALTALLSDKADPLEILQKAWCEHPRESTSLYLRKMTRTLGFVWNDFKQVVFGLDVNRQNFLHGIVLSISLVGVVFICFEIIEMKYHEDPQRFYLLLVVPGLLLIHELLYIPFESTVRYGAPALSFLLLAAAVSAQCLRRSGLRRLLAMLLLIILVVFVIKLEPQRLSFFAPELTVSLVLSAVFKSVSLCLCFGYALYCARSLRLTKGLNFSIAGACVTVLFIALILIPVNVTTMYKENQREQKLELTTNSKLSRAIEFAPLSAPESSSRYFLYLDCDERGLEATVKFNGVVLKGALQSINKIDSSCYSIFNIMRIYSSVFDKPTDALRQWRVLEIPVELIRRGSSNRLLVCAGPKTTGLTVFSDRFDPQETAIQLPNRALFSASRMCNEGLELDGRVLETNKTERYAPAAEVDGQPLKGSIQPRIFVLEANSGLNGDPKTRRVASFAGVMPLASFDPVLLASGGNDALKIDRYTLQLARTNTASLALPPRFCRARELAVSLSGRIKKIGRFDKIGIFLTLSDSKGSFATLLPGSPPFISAKSEWCDFAIRDQVILAQPSENTLKVLVSLFPGRWEQMSQYGLDRSVGSFLVKDLELSVVDASSIDLAQAKIVLH